MILDKYSYVPLLRSREAELKGFEHLNDETLDNCLPVIELTRSRRSKTNSQGDISKNLDKIEERMGDRPFILDITVIEEFSNTQTERLIDPTESFSNWVQFISEQENKNIIPMVHLAEGMTERELELESARLAEHSQTLAIRIDYANNSLTELVGAIRNGIGDLSRLIVILDAGFLITGSERDFDDLLISSIDAIAQIEQPAAIVTLSSSFPSSVKDKGYGGDAEGGFGMSEVLLTRLVKEQRANLPIYHGDYSSIHPIRYPAAFGGWVPRVDVPLNDEYFYHRRRRDSGGYELAAAEVLEDDRYENADTWGDEQIALAAEGSPEGRSPSHWIAVRINIHISRQSRQWHPH